MSIHYTTVFHRGDFEVKASQVEQFPDDCVLRLHYDSDDISIHDMSPEGMIRLGQQIEKAGRDLAVQLAYQQNQPAECHECAALAAADPVEF